MKTAISPNQAQEGQEILENYYYQFIAGETAMARPLAVEGLIKGRLLVNDLEFKISERYDRLDFLGDGLELIDYKSTKEVKLPKPDEIDLQIGLYYIALEQRYQSCLQQLSLLYLRTGEKIVFEASSQHKQQVETVIGELAWRLRTDEEWEAKTGEQCEACSFNRYCAAAADQPEPLPQSANTPQQMQLSLNLLPARYRFTAVLSSRFDLQARLHHLSIHAMTVNWLICPFFGSLELIGCSSFGVSEARFYGTSLYW